jgi:hypothetical protein
MGMAMASSVEFFAIGHVHTLLFGWFAMGNGHACTMHIFMHLLYFPSKSGFPKVPVS